MISLLENPLDFIHVQAGRQAAQPDLCNDHIQASVVALFSSDVTQREGNLCHTAVFQVPSHISDVALINHYRFTAQPETEKTMDSEILGGQSGHISNNPKILLDSLEWHGELAGKMVEC